MPEPLVYALQSLFVGVTAMDGQRFISLLILLSLVGCGGEDSTETKVTKSRSSKSLLQMSGSPEIISAGEHGISVYPRARAAVGPGYDLALTGAGTRSMKILIANVDIYVAAHYMPTRFSSSSNALGAISRSPVEAMVLTLVRDISAEQLREAFREGLENNNISPSSPMMKQVFQALTFDVMSGTEVTFVTWSDGSGNERLFVDAPQLATSYAGKEIGLKLWTTWFGSNPADDGLAELKAQLMGGS